MYILTPADGITVVCVGCHWREERSVILLWSKAGDAAGRRSPGLVSAKSVSTAGFEDIVSELIEIELSFRVQSFKDIDLFDASYQLSIVDNG
jgi:hypothetical protein